MLICPLGSLLMNKLWTEGFIALHLLLLTFFRLPAPHQLRVACQMVVIRTRYLQLLQKPRMRRTGKFLIREYKLFTRTCNDKRSPLDDDINGTLCVFFLFAIFSIFSHFQVFKMNVCWINPCLKGFLFPLLSGTSSSSTCLLWRKSS